MNLPRRLHFSLHDVTPHHMERLVQAEALFERIGVTHVTYLYVPDFHHLGSSVTQEFKDWVAKPRPFAVEWVLHGFHHVEDALHSQREPDASTKWKRKHMTAGEGEFLALTQAEAVELLQRGIQSFRECIGSKPFAFVPPAWLSNPSLLPALHQVGILFTEDHHGFLHANGKQVIEASVITWATRDIIRRWGSLLVCPILERLWSKHNLIRIATHPHDFDFASTQKSIESTLSRALKSRTAVSLRQIAEQASWTVDEVERVP